MNLKLRGFKIVIKNKMMGWFFLSQGGWGGVNIVA